MKPRQGPYVVDLGFGELASGLELMRRILDRTSGSHPHVTVRYAKFALSSELRQEYARTRVDDLILGDPITFDYTSDPSGISTLVFRCESPTLEAQTYKPDFFHTFSHCTIYDGPPSVLAYDALGVLNSFEWGLMFPPGLRIKPYEKRPGRRALSYGADRLSARLWPTSEGHLEFLDRMGASDRISAVEDIARYLGQHVARRESLVLKSGVPSKTRAAAFQPSLIPSADYGYLDGQQFKRRAKERSRAGVVVTPPQLARQVVHHLVALRGHAAEPLRFGDPAVGAGVFFAQLNRLGSLIESATGIEIDELRAERTAFAFRDQNLTVIHGDFLSVEPVSGAWNFVVANPPYVRSQNLPASAGQLRPHLEASLQLRISGRADLYMYFLLAAHVWMDDNAVAAWLVPSEFTVTDAGQTLRAYLTDKVELLQMHFYDDTPEAGIFQDVLVSSCAIFFRKRMPRRQHQVRVTTGDKISSPRSSIRISVGELRERRRWEPSGLAEPVRIESSTNLRIGDVFRVRRGIATGANSVFVLSSEAVAEMSGSLQYTKPILSRAHLLPTNGVIEADSFGLPIVDGLKWLIDSKHGLDVIGRNSPTLAAYLEASREKALESSLVRRHRPQFYSQEEQRPVPFLFVYMSKEKRGSGNHRFFWNRSRGLVLNNFLRLEPKPELVGRIQDDPGLGERILRLLLSISQDQLRRHGRQYAGGLVKLEPGDLVNVVLPREADEILRFDAFQ